MKNNFKFLALAPMVALATTACGPSTESYDIVISAFGTEFLAEGDDWHEILEEETGLNIKVVHHDDNESLETSMESTDFDIIMPSEYMAAKMFDDNKLETIDWDNMTATKQEMYDSLDSSSQSSSDDINLIDYAMPYARGDLRVHFNAEYSTACTDAIEALMTPTDGGDIPVDVLFDGTVGQACDTAILDDDRNIALLTALYQHEVSGSTLYNANQINNPIISDLDVDVLKTLSDNTVKLAEEDLSYDFSNEKHGLILSYNTDPLWIFDYTDTTPFEIMSMNLKDHSNLWIDTIAMTNDASDDAYAVFDAMHQNMDSSSAVYNWYNSPYKEIESDLAAEISNEFEGTQESFILKDTTPDYYGTIKYDGPDSSDPIANYNSQISKWVLENWGK